jgi:biotin transport system ATP-binding protein
MPSVADPIIKIRNLSHRFADGGLALDGVDLEIHSGSFVVIAGANGSGKTTLLRYFNGLCLGPTGTVMVDGRDVRKHVRAARQQVGMVFQDADSQIVGDTVWDDVAFGPENLRWSQAVIEQAVGNALEWVGLDHLGDKSPHLLSGGERRRLAIAGVLAMQPKVVVFDEPFANLDYPGVRQVLGQIVQLHATGRTIVLSAHDIEKVISHTQRLVILEKGRVVANGDPVSILPTVEQFGIRLPCALRMGHPLESWLN